MTAEKPIFLLGGVTASGKTLCALEWANKTQGLIINADSMQLYKDVATLTARPTKEEMKAADHRLFGILGPQEQFSVGAWLRAVVPFIDEARNGGKKIAIVGGTGLFFNALLFGLAEIGPVSEEIGAKVERVWQNDGEAGLREALLRVDPAAEARILAGDQQRLKRALGVYLEHKRPLSEFQKATFPILKPQDYEARFLLPDRDDLYARCDRRLEKMFDSGAIDEVLALIEQGLAPNWPIVRVLGVREISEFIKGHMSKTDALEAAKLSTRHYAKRQYTWFRNQILKRI